MIKQNVKNLLAEIPSANPFGEKITLVAAVKLQPAEAINTAIEAGITDIGDNHVQEFRNKFPQINGSPKRHFIGHLQTNKITEDNGAFEKKLSKCRKIVDKIQEKWYNLSMSCKGYFTNAQP